MKLIVFICMCLVMPLKGRESGNVVGTGTSAFYGFRNASEINTHKSYTGPWSNATLGKTKDHAKTNLTEKENNLTSLFGYFLEPEFAGILLLVAIVGLSGMKHAD